MKINVTANSFCDDDCPFAKVEGMANCYKEEDGEVFIKSHYECANKELCEFIHDKGYGKGWDDHVDFITELKEEKS